MTRIVKPGIIPVPVTPWQTTTPFTCRHCGCEWYAEGTEWHDIPPLGGGAWTRPSGDAGCAGMDCPTCGRPCQIREPGKMIARGL